MSRPARSLIPLLLMASSASVIAADSWVLHGRVLDQLGQPVANVGVTTYWNANGIPLEDLRTHGKEGGDDTKFSINEGKMEPWGLHPTKTNADGRFAATMEGFHYKLLMIDQERQRGAVITVDPRQVPDSIEVTLLPLVRVVGKVRVAATGNALKDVSVVANLPPSQEVPLGSTRLAVCSSLQSRFEFLLPPGNYEFEVFGHDTPRYILKPLGRVTVTAGQREVDAGTLELTQAPPFLQDRVKAAKAQGTWVDYKKFYGQSPPKWHIVDARGAPKNA